MRRKRRKAKSGKQLDTFFRQQRPTDQVGDILLSDDGRKKRANAASVLFLLLLLLRRSPLSLSSESSGHKLQLEGEGGGGGLKLHLLNRDQLPSFVW